MNTQNNNSPTDFRMRLIILVIVLMVGFVSGWFNHQYSGQADTGTTSGIVAQQQQDQDATDEDEAEATTQTESTSSGTETEQKSDSGITTTTSERGPTVEEDGWYTSKEEVALYIHTYGHLPGNFISKTKARAKGWVASEGNLDEVCPGMSIGGSRFYDDDGQLPYKRGRQWTECDINYQGGFRGAERIVFSNDGLIFYTGDHYETFEQLY